MKKIIITAIFAFLLIVFPCCEANDQVPVEEPVQPVQTDSLR